MKFFYHIADMQITGSRKDQILNISQWLAVLLLISMSIFFSFKDYNQGVKWRVDVRHTKYNNYSIFKTSHEVLVEKGHLYVTHREKHYDWFKYTPTFAFFIQRKSPD